MNRRVTSPTWDPPPPCKQTLSDVFVVVAFVVALAPSSENALYSVFFDKRVNFPTKRKAFQFCCGQPS